MTKKGKKRVIALSAAFVMLFYIHYTRNHRRKETCFVINKGNITYSGGTIYIGNKKYIESLGEVEPGDVRVIDERRSEDPNMKVLDSYKIIRPSVRNEIIDALLYFPLSNPNISLYGKTDTSTQYSQTLFLRLTFSWSNSSLRSLLFSPRTSAYNE